MRNFDFYSPTYFVFGKDREAETGRYVKRFGGSRVLVVYGGQSAKRSGLLDRIMACLKEENLYAEELGGVKPNPRSGLVYEGIELCRRAEGSTSCWPSAAAASSTPLRPLPSAYPMTAISGTFFSGKMPEQALPVGTVLTICRLRQRRLSGLHHHQRENSGEERRGSRLPPSLLLRAGPCPHGKSARLSDGLRHHGHHGPHL